MHTIESTALGKQNVILASEHLIPVVPIGAVGRALHLRYIGRWFESCLGTITQWPKASYLQLCASVTKQYNLVPVKGR